MYLPKFCNDLIYLLALSMMAKSNMLGSRMLAVIFLFFLKWADVSKAETAATIVEPFIVGATRHDTVIVPFALYKCGKWSKMNLKTCSSEAISQSNIEAVLTSSGLKDIPMAWFLWSENAEQPVLV